MKISGIKNLFQFTRQEQWVLRVLVGTFLLGIIVLGLGHDRKNARLNSLEASYRGMDLAYPATAGADTVREVVRSRSRNSGKTVTDSLRLDINLAGEQELVQLPRIGPMLARRIIEYRQEHGAFQKLEDLIKIRGIGEKTLERIRPYIFIQEK